MEKNETESSFTTTPQGRRPSMSTHNLWLKTKIDKIFSKKKAFILPTTH